MSSEDPPYDATGHHSITFDDTVDEFFAKFNTRVSEQGSDKLAQELQKSKELAARKSQELIDKDKRIADLNAQVEVLKAQTKSSKSKVNNAAEEPHLTGLAESKHTDIDVAKVYKEGELRGYLRYARDLEVYAARQGRYPGVKLEESDYAFLVDEKHPHSPANMGYEIGYTVGSALIAQAYEEPTLDLRYYKTPISEEALTPINPKTESAFWLGVARGRHAREAEVKAQNHASKKIKVPDA